MSKKTNTLLFVLGGTVFNIITTILCFVLFMIIFGRFAQNVPETAIIWILPIFFILSIAASFFIYRLVVKIVTKKIDLEEHFDPIFGRRRPRPPRNS